MTKKMYDLLDTELQFIVAREFKECWQPEHLLM